jgi:S1-C subfamily serine protease
MRRIAVETVGALAAAVLVVALYRQITTDARSAPDTAILDPRIGEAAATGGRQDRMRDLELVQARIEQAIARMQALEERLQSTAVGSQQEAAIADEIERAKADVATFRSQIAADFARTQALVDAHIREVRAKEQDAAARLSQTQGAIEKLASRVYRDPDLLTRTMLLPTVQLNGDDTVGSGTIVSSGRNAASDAVETYVLTSYHVVRNILADTPRAASDGIDVTVYLPGERLVAKGRLVASHPRIDAALLRLATDRVLPYVADVLPRSEVGSVKVWDPVCAVGCPLGNDPVPSHGEVSSLRNELNGTNYWMVNAPTYFGNSGGGIYRTDTHQLIGVFSKIYTHGKGTPVVVPHMGLCTPIEAIHDWLAAEKLDHLLSAQRVAEFAAPAK